MGKNLIPEVCKLLGVEVGEKFRVRCLDGTIDNETRYYIEDDGGVYECDFSGEHLKYFNICELLNGNYEIVKLPWKPKNGEQYWTFETLRDESTVPCCIVGYSIWMGAMSDFACFKAGWVYRTKEEAETALPAIANELGVAYKL